MARIRGQGNLIATRHTGQDHPKWQGWDKVL
jgi:hypothetical protein